jgi:Flp pilus assembly protein TadD
VWFALLLFLIASPFAAPATFDEAYRAGLTALQRNQLGAAMVNLQTAAKLQPSNGRVWVALAQTYRKLHEPGNAEAAAAKAFSLTPNDPLVIQSLVIYYFEAAQPLLQREKFADAITLLRDAANKLGKHSQLELALGVSYYGLRRFNEAADAFLNTIALSPGTEQPYIFLGRMLEQIPERLPKVTKLFADFEKPNPSNYRGYLLHAKALNAQFIEPETARKLLARAIALNDRDASAHFELGVLLDRMHLFSEAAAEFERAALLEPSDAATHYRLARLYDRLDKPEAAAVERERHAKLIKAQDAMR